MGVPRVVGFKSCTVWVSAHLSSQQFLLCLRCQGSPALNQPQVLPRTWSSQLQPLKPFFSLTIRTLPCFAHIIRFRCGRRPRLRLPQSPSVNEYNPMSSWIPSRHKVESIHAESSTLWSIYNEFILPHDHADVVFVAP